MLKSIYTYLFLYFLFIFSAFSTIDDGIEEDQILTKIGSPIFLECSGATNQASEFRKTFNVKLSTNSETIGFLEVSNRYGTPYFMAEILQINFPHQNKGYGKQVASIIFEKYKSLFKNFALAVDPINIGAIRLYKKLGFQEVSYIPGILVAEEQLMLLDTSQN